MSRRDRRAAIAAQRKKPLPKARADGRPLYYDINPMEMVACYFCELRGLKGQRYRINEGFMADPANSPDGSGDMFTICKHHVPDNAVIYNPHSNMCRNKDGTNTWMEDNPKMDSDAKIAAKSGVNPFG